MPTKCTRVTTRPAGVSPLRSRKPSPLMSTLSSWEYGKSSPGSVVSYGCSSEWRRDTVDSVGIIPHRLPFTRSNTAIRTFRHALALDERRVRFRPALYAPASAADTKLGTQPGDMPKHDTTFAMRKGLNGGAKKGKNKQRHFERTFCENDPDCNRETNVLEVWFAGCHCGTSLRSVRLGNERRVLIDIIYSLLAQTSAVAACRTIPRTRSRASRSGG